MPRVKLTARSIEKLTPADGQAQTDYFDEDSRGLAVRVGTTGTKVFYLFYRFGRQFKRYKVGVYPDLSLSRARDEAEKLRYQINHQGKDPAEQRQTDRTAETVKDVANAFMAKYSTAERKKSWKEDKRILERYVIPEIGLKLARNVERHHIRTMLDPIAERAPVMANRVLACTRKLFKWAMDEDYTINNPCVGISAPGGEEKARERTLNNAELKAVWNASTEEDLGAILQLQLLTLARIGEIVRMKWTDIDFDKATWTQPDSKNGRQHIVPLSPKAVSILKKLKTTAEAKAKKKAEAKGTKPDQEMSPWVFEGRGTKRSVVEFQKLVGRVREAAKVGSKNVEFRSHDLRRTAASRISENGVSRVVLKKLLNHSEAGDVTGKVYDKYEYLPERRAALEWWARQLTQITTGLKSVAATQKA
jgi:integrase